MPSYVEEEKSFDIPKAAGDAAYVETLKKLLRLTLVQSISITPGHVRYKRYRREDEPEATVAMDFDSIMPMATIRSHDLVELRPTSKVAAIVIAQMLIQASLDGMNPVAFASGGPQTVRAWHVDTTKLVLPENEIYGIPFLVDQDLPKEALFLCVAYSRYGALVDIVKTYKMTIPAWRAP